jgi:cytochrome oxidase assembly protein ShyY1
MVLADGSAVLVNRGFVPLPATDVPAPPGGEVTVAGRLRPSQDRRLGQLSDPETGDLTEMQRVDIERFQQQIDVPLEPMYLDAFVSDPADSPRLEPVAKPDLSEGPHQSYAFQWFIFSVCVAVGWVLAVRRSIKTHQRKLAAAALTISEVDGGDLDELVDQHPDREGSQ